jgi:hypothetical protein
LDEGGPESHMPHANQLWMLVGFALFEVLNKHYECIEVFPQAIAHALRARTIHKSSSEGMALQLAAVARHSGWPLKEENLSLSKVAFGSLQDKLDAYLSAWVASLSRKECHPCGEPPSDVIWIPRCRGNSHLNLKNAS